MHSERGESDFLGVFAWTGSALGSRDPKLAPLQARHVQGRCRGTGFGLRAMLSLRRGVSSAAHLPAVVCTCLARGSGRLPGGRGKDPWVRNHLILLDVIGGCGGNPPD